MSMFLFGELHCRFKMSHSAMFWVSLFIHSHPQNHPDADHVIVRHMQPETGNAAPHLVFI